jgi:hypothetical protein
VQAFRVTTQLEQAERCLFVPLKLLNFRDSAVVERWRDVLARSALSARVQRQLTVEYGVVEVIPQTPRVTPGRIIVTSGVRGVLTRMTVATSAVAAAAAAATTTTGGATTGTTDGTTPPSPPPAAAAVQLDYRRAPLTSATAVLAEKGWDIDQLNAVGFASGRVLGRPGLDTVFVSDDALVLGFALREGQAVRFSVRRRDGNEVAALEATATAFALREPVALKELSTIAIQHAGDRDIRTRLALQLSVAGTAMPLDVPIALKAGGPSSALQDVIKFGAVSAAQELMDHLEANRLHYSQSVFRSLDAATLASVLSGFSYRGLPVGQLVDAQPVASTANYLVFKVNVATRGNAEDERWNAEQTAWRDWLAKHGLDRPAPKSEIIPLPSGGVFAEAVLGRFNAAEKIDLTRFWNWQDSPIPITAPEIAPVEAGSRAQSDEIRPGQLSAPVVTIQNPTSLPDPTGVAAILGALQQGNMFRDMSGLAQTAALAQAGLQASAQGATAAGQQAANTLATVMANNTERMRIAAQLIAAAAGIPTTGAGGQQPPGKGTLSERGGELNAAQAIGQQIDQSASGGGSGGGSLGGSGGSGGGGSGGGVDSGGTSIDPGMSTGTPSPGTQLVADTFRQQFAAGGGGGTSPVAERFVQTLLDNTGADESLFLAGGDGGGGGGGTTRKPRTRTIEVTGRFVTDIDEKFLAGDILMRVFDGHGERVVWQSGTKAERYLVGPGHNGEIKSPKLTLTKDTVTVELRARMFKGDHDILPDIPIVFVGGANVYEVPSNGKLRVTGDVESSYREWRVDAPDEGTAVAKVTANRPIEEDRRTYRRETVKLSEGKYLVKTWTWTKRFLMRTPQALEEIYLWQSPGWTRTLSRRCSTAGCRLRSSTGRNLKLERRSSARSWRCMARADRRRSAARPGPGSRPATASYWKMIDPSRITCSAWRRCCGSSLRCRG